MRRQMVTTMYNNVGKRSSTSACAKHTDILTIKGGARRQVTQNSSDLHNAQNYNTGHSCTALQSLLFYTYSCFQA